MSAIVVGLGLLLVHFFVEGPAGPWDAGVSRWFVAQRTGVLNSLTAIGSDIGSTFVIIGVAVVAGTALATRRHWPQIGFLVCGLALEFTIFLTATVFVDRARPHVPRLDPSPPTSSYPSGHTAAAIVLYVGLALVLSSLVRSVVVRAIVWVLAVALPIFVGVSRVYRGMHHATDVLASLILGAGALTFAMLAVRAATTVSDHRHSIEAPHLKPPPTRTGERAGGAAELVP
jgi:membrane-associated phospholipid phosphatase